MYMTHFLPPVPRNFFLKSSARKKETQNDLGRIRIDTAANLFAHHISLHETTCIWDKFFHFFKHVCIFYEKYQLVEPQYIKSSNPKRPLAQKLHRWELRNSEGACAWVGGANAHKLCTTSPPKNPLSKK